MIGVLILAHQSEGRVTLPNRVSKMAACPSNASRGHIGLDVDPFEGAEAGYLSARDRPKAILAA